MRAEERRYAKYDSIIIGTGQAGPSLAHRLDGRTGRRDRAPSLWRHCVKTGCTPTKTLVASAYAAHLARRAGDFGVSVAGPVTVDMKKVKERKDYVLGSSTRGVERALRNNPNITVYPGHARFNSTESLVVGDETLTASKIFINVGSRAPVPEIPGLVGTHVLVAVGRRPNTDDLHKAGVAVDKRGYIEVDDQLNTSVPSIWALGDCNGRGAFTHTAYNDFEIVAANLLDNDPRRVSDRIPAYNLYTDPPLGRVGMTEAEVRKTGKRALIAKMAMEDVSRAFEKGETQGVMKILVDAESKQFLGASILGVGGDEVVHSILDLMYAKAQYTVMPTVSELLPTMLGDLKPLE